MTQISFIDLKSQKERLGSRIEQAINRVLDHGQYILGPEVHELEKKLSEFCGAKHVLTCSNGTDALTMILMAKEIKPSDAVLVPSFTFAASAEVIAQLGATPIFVDVHPDTFNIDPKSIEQGILTAKKCGLKPKAIIAVDLFGQPADYDLIEKIAKEQDLWILADAAQSFGAVYQGRKVGTLGLATSTSFYPAKPLGCYGDGGCIFTEDEELAQILKSIRVHGAGSHRYDNVRIGINGRLDTIQAAILLEKLTIFKDEIKARQKIAAKYSESLKNMVQIPKVLSLVESVWAQYTIVLPKGSRDEVKMHLEQQGVPTVVYYPKPLHCQTAYREFPCAGGKNLPVSERLADSVLSLPLHPYLEVELQNKIIRCLTEFLPESNQQVSKII